MANRDVYYTTARLSRDVEEALRAYAQQDGRSINDSINRILSNALLGPVDPKTITVTGEDAPERAELTQRAYLSLTRPEFRKRLRATAPDGTQPIIVALRDDPIRTLIDRVRGAGGVGNVVFPEGDGLGVLAVHDTADLAPQREETKP